MKKEPVFYELKVGGVTLETFAKKPPKAVRQLHGCGDIEITPPIVEKIIKKKNKNQKQLNLFGEI